MVSKTTASSHDPESRRQWKGRLLLFVLTPLAFDGVLGRSDDHDALGVDVSGGQPLLRVLHTSASATLECECVTNFIEDPLPSIKTNGMRKPHDVEEETTFILASLI